MRYIIPNELPASIKEIWDNLETQEEKDHPLVREGTQGTCRFLQRELEVYIMNHISLNDLAIASIPIDQVKRLYRWGGYSLCGYWEVFYQ